MGKMISGSILILTAGILFATRVIASSIIVSGLGVSGPGIYDDIVGSYSYSIQLLIASILLAVIGFALLIWGVRTNMSFEKKTTP